MYKILLVEDDKNIQSLIVNYFTKKEKDAFTVEVAEDGQTGVEKAFENNYDLLLLDVMLPELDGFEICRDIRRDSDIPIMFITAKADESDILNGYALGCDPATIYEDTYLIQYAREVNLLNKCKSDLLIGTAVIFAFFLTIALILCLMIWRTVKTQIVQEQKRADVTGAPAHDIKTPLFIISGYAYSLKEDIDPGERDGYLDKIIEQTDAINRLVQNMLNLSKLDSYKMTLSRTDFDLRELTAEILADYSSLPDDKTITVAQSGEGKVNADRELIKTVIQNLIENAVKYSPKNSKIQIEVGDNTFEIRNESERLTRADLKQIWEPYVRKDKSRRQNGNGLGLSIVKSILDLHGAKYEADMLDSTFICAFKL